MSKNVQPLLSELKEAVQNNNFLRSIELSEEVYKLQIDGQDLLDESVCEIVRLLHQGAKTRKSVFEKVINVLQE